MRPISLHQIVVPEIPATELVRIAARLGCKHVCLFTEMVDGFTRFHVVRDEDIQELQRVMHENEVTAYGVTSFAIQPEIDIASYADGLDRGAQLGAQFASVRIPDIAAHGMASAFERFAMLAAGFGIMPSIEIVGFNDQLVVQRTLRIIEEVGTGTLTLDPLHIVRTGALEIYRRLTPSQIGYIQLCDGPLAATEQQYWHEAAAERLPPGEGEFPLDAILSLAPEGRAVSPEVPCERLHHEGRSPLDRASRVIAATRNLLEAVEGQL
jgi:sugar phosphate isomerase/epimerase